MTLLFLLGEFVLLWFLARFVFQKMYDVFRLLRFSRKNAILLLSFIFLPGTFLHEIAHYLTASGLGVRAGNFTIFPKEEGGHIKMGSVRVERCDPIRSFFIGVAPFIVGILFMSGILFGMEALHAQNMAVFHKTLLYIVGGYALFVIVNMMFSSRKDIEAGIEFISLVGIALVILFFWGGDVWIGLVSLFKKEIVVDSIHLLSQVLLFPIGINCVVIFLALIFKKAIDR